LPARHRPDDRDQRGHYLLIVKENQGELFRLLQLYLDGPLRPYVRVQEQQEGDMGHGRSERRHLRVTAAVAGKLGWPGLSQGFRLERWAREKKTGKERQEVVYGITSLPAALAGAEQLLRLTRGQWTIENRSHWVRDVTFGEDQSQVRCGSIPQVLAAVRNTAIGLLRRAGHTNMAAATRYYAARPCEALALLGIPMTTK
jgi:predicted transposase YbfD/YdcC